MGGNSIEELSRYHIVSCGDEFAVHFSKNCLRISMLNPKLESHRVKIANRKLMQLSPKLRRVGKEVSKELRVAFSSTVVQRSIWQDTGVDKHQQKQRFQPVEALLS